MSGATELGPSLTFEGVSVARGGRPVVFDINIEVPAGQVTTMLGPNGAGKSTLALATAGMARTVAGSIKLGGESVSNKRAERVRAMGISVVPEGRRLLTELSVEDNLKVATYSLGKKAGAEGLAYTLSLFPELEKRWEIGGRLLSGGEQQMVVLAQALVSRPKILVVDELSLGLAPIVVKRLVPVLADVAASGVGVLLIEQFAHVALGLATKAYVLESGRVRYDGTAAELKEKPELLHSAYLLRN
jgi:branched-chain amino acid transport system ATP-binding protein